MMEFGTVMIDIKSNYETEDEGLMDEEIIPDWNKIKNVIHIGARVDTLSAYFSNKYSNVYSASYTSS